MSLLYKLVVPLLDSHLCMEDFDSKKGFIDAYGYDKNKPYLNNHVFLVYDASIQDHERNVRFRELTNLYKRYVEYINNKPYYIYVFPCLSADVKNLLNKGEKPKDVNNNARIASFWRGWESDVNEYMFYKSYKLYNTWESVPEYDYRPSVEEIILYR